MKAFLVFVSISLIFSINALAGSWQITDLDTGKAAKNQNVVYGTQDWYRLKLGYNCIDGDIQKAFQEINILGDKQNKVTKLDFSKDQIRVNVVGPVCVEEPQDHDDVCRRYEVKSHDEVVPACNSNAKYFESSFVPQTSFFNTITIRDLTSQKVTSVYFAGDLQTRIMRKTGVLDLDLYNFVSAGEKSSSTRFLVMMDPNLEFQEGGVVGTLETRYPPFDSKTDCLVQDLSNSNQFATLVCTNTEAQMIIPNVPYWALGRASYHQQSLDFRTKKDFGLYNTRNGKELEEGYNYSSLAQLWYLIDKDVCVAGNLQSAADYVSRHKGFNNLLRKVVEIKSYQVNQGKIQFQGTYENCVREERVGPDVHKCVEIQVVQASFTLPQCQ